MLPASGLHGRVVGHHRDGATGDFSQPGDDAVGRKLAVHAIRERPILDERTRVEESRQALTGEEFSDLRILGVVLRSPTLPDAVAAMARAVVGTHGGPGLYQKSTRGRTGPLAAPRRYGGLGVRLGGLLLERSPGVADRGTDDLWLEGLADDSAHPWEVGGSASSAPKSAEMTMTGNRAAPKRA